MTFRDPFHEEWRVHANTTFDNPMTSVERTLAARVLTLLAQLEAAEPEWEYGLRFPADYGHTDVIPFESKRARDGVADAITNPNYLPVIKFRRPVVRNDGGWERE